MVERGAEGKASTTTPETAGNGGAETQLPAASAGGAAAALRHHKMRRRAQRRAEGGAAGGPQLKGLDDIGLRATTALPARAATSASAVAREGLADGGSSVPHKGEMERSFGADLGHVQAHVGPAAQRACASLGAEAFALGQDIAFASTNPTRETVAHELTHVAQSSQSGAVANKGAAGVDDSGEVEARAVERAVAAGRPASDVLGDDGAGARGEGPALLGLTDLGLSAEIADLDHVSPGASLSLFAADTPNLMLYAPLLLQADLAVSASASVGAEVANDPQRQTAPAAGVAAPPPTGSVEAVSASISLSGALRLFAGTDDAGGDLGGLNVNGQLTLSGTSQGRLQLRPQLAFDVEALAFKATGSVGVQALVASVDYPFAELPIFTVVGLHVGRDGVRASALQLAPEFRRFCTAVHDMIHFDESMERNRQAGDTDVISGITSADGDLNATIIGAQARPDPSRGQDWITAARRIHQHLVEGHLSEVIGALVDDERAGGELRLTDAQKTAARSTVSTMERVLDSRACGMDAARLATAANRLDALCGLRRDRGLGIDDNAFTRARNVLRELSGGNAQGAASELGFRS